MSEAKKRGAGAKKRGASVVERSSVERAATEKPGAEAAASGAPRGWWTGWPGLAAAAILAALLFAPTLRYGFLYDDMLYVWDNPQIRSVSNLFECFWTTFPKHQPEFGTYRPLAHLTLTLDYSMAGEVANPLRPGERMADPTPFHATNVLLHAAATLLFLLLARSLLDRTKWGPAPEFAALLFAVHPVHVEAVANVSGRSELLAGVFYLAALWTFVRAVDAAPGSSARWRWLGAALATAFLSFCSKETAITYPIAAAFVLWMKRGAAAFAPAKLEGEGPALSRGNRSKGNFGETCALLLPIAALTILYLGARLWAIGSLGAPKEMHYYERIPGLSRSASSSFVFLYYLKLFFIPTHFYPDLGYPFHMLGATVPPIVDWSSPWAVAGLASGVAVALAFLWLALRRSDWAWAVGLYLIPLLVFLQFIEFGDIAADRFLYLPSAGGCLLVAMALARAARGSGGASAIGAVSVLALLLGAKTLHQSNSWRDVRSFHGMLLSQPDNEEAQYDIGVHERNQGWAIMQELMRRGRAGKLDPGADGLLVDKLVFHYRQAILRMEKTLQLSPTFDRARAALSEIYYYYVPPEFERSREQARILLAERFPEVAHEAHTLRKRIAKSYGEERNYVEGLAEAKRAWRANRADAEARWLVADMALSLAAQRLGEGDYESSLEYAKEARAANADRREPRLAVAIALEALGRWPEAAEEWKALVRDYPMEPGYQGRAARAEQFAADPKNAPSAPELAPVATTETDAAPIGESPAPTP